MGFFSFYLHFMLACETPVNNKVLNFYITAKGIILIFACITL